MTVIRRALLAAFAALLCACAEPPAPPTPAAPVDATDPVAVITAIYQPYLDPAATPPPWYDALPMTAELNAMIQEDRAATGGEIGAVSVNPIISAQDCELADLNVRLDAPPADGRAAVTARFTNFGSASSIHFDLVQSEPGGAWLVDNVSSADGDLRLQFEAFRARR